MLNCQICDNSIKRSAYSAISFEPQLTYTHPYMHTCTIDLYLKESALKTTLCQLNFDLANALRILTHAVHI